MSVDRLQNWDADRKKVTGWLKVLMPLCWSVSNAANNRKYMTAAAGQSPDRVTWCALYLRNVSGHPGGLWRPCSSASEHTHFLPPLKATLGLFTWYFPGWWESVWATAWGTMELPWARLGEKSCYLWHSSLSCAQHWPHSGQLGEPAGWAGSCSRHMQPWLWPADPMACQHSHHVRSGHWEKQKRKGCSKAKRSDWVYVMLVWKGTGGECTVSQAE